MPKPRWKRSDRLKLRNLSLNGTSCLAGARSVLSQARKMTATTEDNRVINGPKGVSQPVIISNNANNTGIVARGISCFTRNKNCCHHGILRGSWILPVIFFSVIRDIMSIMRTLNRICETKKDITADKPTKTAESSQESKYHNHVTHWLSGLLHIKLKIA